MKTKKEKTAEIQKSLETRVKAPIAYFDSRKYIQHNLSLGDGLAPILALMDALPADRTRVEVLGTFEDGDHSVAHLDYELGDWGKMVGFEVHRWENDRIVEHWDNLQPKPNNANASGWTMTDGPHEVTELHRTDANKALVERFTNEVLIGRDRARAHAYFAADALIQHSPLHGDGVATMLAALGGAGSAAGGPEYHRLHKLLGEGNMVLAISEGTIRAADDPRRPAAFYDLYRLSDDAITEHWDVIETIPPREEWKNDNGKF